MTWASPTASENSSHSCDSCCAFPYEVDITSALVGYSCVGKGWDLAITLQRVVVWVSAEENRGAQMRVPVWRLLRVGSDESACLEAVVSGLR